MVGISSMHRLVTLDIVAIGMSHAVAVKAEASSATDVTEKADSPDTSVLHGGDAVVYNSKAGSAPSVTKREGESPSVTKGGCPWPIRLDPYT